jgi:cyanophycin synthetase
LSIVVLKDVVADFFSERGTWMGHVIEHIALEIQSLAGMETGFGRTRETKTPGTYNVVFSYTEENVGLCCRIFSPIAEALIAGTDYDLNADLQKCKYGNVFGLGQVPEV